MNVVELQKRVRDRNKAIQTLEAENAKLRAALEEIIAEVGTSTKAAKIARAALKQLELK